MIITIQKDIKEKDVQNLLCNAFEGGSNYWYSIVKQIKPKTFIYRTDHEQIFPHLDYPINPTGFLIIKDNLAEPGERQLYSLSPKVLLNGLQIMAKDYPNHFNDFITEQDDATTGDVFLQCCLFKKVIYG